MPEAIAITIALVSIMTGLYSSLVSPGVTGCSTPYPKQTRRFAPTWIIPVSYFTQYA